MRIINHLPGALVHYHPPLDPIRRPGQPCSEGIPLHYATDKQEKPTKPNPYEPPGGDEPPFDLMTLLDWFNCLASFCMAMLQFAERDGWVGVFLITCGVAWGRCAINRGERARRLWEARQLAAYLDRNPHIVATCGRCRTCDRFAMLDDGRCPECRDEGRKEYFDG